MPKGRAKPLRRAVIDSRSPVVNVSAMDGDEPRARDDALAALAKQDLDPLSVAELDARVTALEAEIARVKAHRDRAVRHKASAESLFKS